MTIHKMRLQAEPFEKIRSGRKTIELRLLDEKRKKIQIGDTIRFSCDQYPHEVLSTTVTNLFSFPSFAVLYESLPMTDCGYSTEDSPSPTDMEQYYSLEEQSKYGVLGIQIKLI